MGVKVATSDDCDTVITLWQACELTRPWNDPHSDFSQAVEGASSDILMFVEDDELVGSVMVGFDGHRGWVYYLAVLPSKQRRGFGIALMKAAEKWLRERNAPKIQLMVRDDNINARGFYKAIGYEVQKVVTIGKRL